MSNLMIADLSITGPFCVLDLNTGHYIFQHLDRSAPGDIPPDIAALPVAGLRTASSDSGSVLYIDTYA